MSEQNNIVAAKFADNNKTTVAADPKGPQRLNVKHATEIGGALERWHTLRNLAIKTPTSDAEIAGLTEYLANNLLTYAPELLGCWFVIRQEYEPLVNTIANIMNRASEVQAQRRAALAAQQQATQEARCCKRAEDIKKPCECKAAGVCSETEGVD